MEFNQWLGDQEIGKKCLASPQAAHGILLHEQLFNNEFQLFSTKQRPEDGPDAVSVSVASVQTRLLNQSVETPKIAKSEPKHVNIRTASA